MSFAEAGAKTPESITKHPPGQRRDGGREREREREIERETHFIVSDKNAVDGQTPNCYKGGPPALRRSRSEEGGGRN